MKLGLERIKTLAELTQRLTVILGQILTRLVSVEESDSSDLISRLEDIESNFIDKRVVFPLGTSGLNGFYGVSDGSQSVADGGTLLVDFDNLVEETPYVLPDVLNQTFTVQASGEYYIFSTLYQENASTNLFHVENRVLINGGVRARGRIYVQTSGNFSNQNATNCSVKIFLEAGDEIQIQAFQNNSDNLSRTINATDSLSHLSVSFLGNFS